MWYTKNHVWTTSEIEEAKYIQSRTNKWHIFFMLRQVTANTFWKFFKWMRDKKRGKVTGGEAEIID